MEGFESLDDRGRVRRRLLRSSVWFGAGFAVGGLPYRAPAMKSFFGTRAAWAQPSGPTSLVVQGSLGRGGAGAAEDTGSDWWRVEVLEPNTRLTITASPDAFLDVELFLFAPGVPPRTGTNLLTGSFAPFDQTGVGAGESVSLVAAGAGAYVLVIEDARPPTSEKAGQYSLRLEADKPLGAVIQIVDEEPEIQSHA